LNVQSPMARIKIEKQTWVLEFGTLKHILLI